MIPYKVQVMGGIAIHKGDIAEMRTGEVENIDCNHADVFECFSW